MLKTGGCETSALDRKLFGTVCYCVMTLAFSQHSLPTYLLAVWQEADSGLVMVRRQSLTAFGSAALENKPSCFGTHPYTKSMRLRTTTIIRLKRSLHYLSP